MKNETILSGADAEVPGFRRRLIQLCRICGKFRPKVVELGGGLSDAFSLVANDGAVGILPAFMHHIKRPGMVMIPISDAAATWDLMVVWQRGNASEPLRALLDFLPSVG